MKISIIIPAYNEEKTLASVIKEARKYTNKIIVIDDASHDSTYKIAKREGAKVYKHEVNKGLGGALKTGLNKAIEENTDIAITLDADLQHDPNEIPSLIKPILENEADVVIGSRFIINQKMPVKRKIYNKIGNIITYILFGVKCKDSQSGFRVFNKKALKLINIKTNGMEVSSEIIKEVRRNNLKLKEIPIKAIYTKYSISKGQNFFSGIKTFFHLLKLKFQK